MPTDDVETAEERAEYTWTVGAFRLERAEALRRWRLVRALDLHLWVRTMEKWQ